MSFSHMLILGIIAVIVVPPDKLPEVARQFARFLGDMRRMTSGLFDDLKDHPVLKPDDLMKEKQSTNIIQPPQVTAPDAAAPVIEAKSQPTPEEKKLQEDEYLKHIQGEASVDEKDEKKPT